MQTIAVLNNKGGSGKTTTTLHLGNAFAEAGRRTLLIDIDGQCNLTAAWNVVPESMDIHGDISTVLDGSATIDSPIIDLHARLHLLPADRRYLDETSHEMSTPSKVGWLFRLRSGLETLRQCHDLVLIDCPPNLGTLTYTALIAADLVLIPTQAEDWSIQGVYRTLDKLREMRQDMGRAPSCLGIIATQVEDRTNIHQAGLSKLRTVYGRQFLGYIPKRKGTGADAQIQFAYDSIAQDLLGIIK